MKETHHDIGEDRAANANEGSDGSQKWIVEHQPLGDQSEPRIGIERRDHNR
jgi:hypothetical protein